MNAFLAELRRRNVFRVAAVYLIAAWVVLQVVNNVVGPMALPTWTPGLVIVLLGVGFPVALIVAWAFELTPEGVRRSTVEAGAPPSKLASADMILIAAVVALVGVSLFQAVRPRPTPSAAELAAASQADAAPAAVDRLSIAVLPFADMSPQSDQEYFSDGLSEELLNSLAQIRALRVAGRTSSFSFKGRNEDLRVIGEQLNVANVLEGSVRKDGDRLRITAQLVSAADGYHLWSHTYDRQLDDVFAVQAEIAEAVAQALSVTLGVDAPRRDVGTDSADAYDFYLRARATGVRAPFTSDQQLHDAIALLEQALALDPEFAQAWAEIAFNEGSLAFSAETAEEQAALFEAMEAAVLRAIEIAPESWEAQSALGQLRMSRKRWLDAERAFNRAYEYSGRSDAVMGQARWNYILQTGRLAASMDSMEQVLAVDPLAAGDGGENLEFLLGRRDRPNEANTAPSTYVQLDALLATADDDAVTAYMQGPPQAGLPSELLADIWAAPAGARADAIRDYLAAQEFYVRTPLWALALLAARIGEQDLAVELLDAGFVEIDGPSAYWSIWGPTLAETRRTPAFKGFLRDLGLVELWRTTGEWGDFCRPVGEDDFACE
jgi:TolB-like protein